MKTIKADSVFSRPGFFYEPYLSNDNADINIQRKKKRNTEDFDSACNIKPKLKGFDHQHDIIRSNKNNPFKGGFIPEPELNKEDLKDNEEEKVEQPRKKVSSGFPSKLNKSSFSHN